MTSPTPKVLTLPNPDGLALSIRAKALVFNDPQSAQLLQQIEQIGASPATALLIGETGTGKEVVARHLHTCSGRQGPFIAVNCGAFNESLIDAELFGHEAGAFTGATQSRPGWFEAANGGTLFLDEIGDMPLHLQVKLLRVLQERQVTRLGARQSIPVDVRLIAATNVELAKAVQAGRFRADLFYRLHVAVLQLPPLRERPGDVLPLARHFAEVYRRRLGLTSIAFAPAAERALLAHGWPGNIRELENVVHYALIVSRDNVIQRQDLRLRQPLSSRDSLEPTPVGLEGVAQAVRQLLDQQHPQLYEALEEVIVRTAFEHCGSNQVRTARELGVSRNILRAQLKRLGLLGERLVIEVD
jgi:sigma-54-specific transcriptional regulator